MRSFSQSLLISLLAALSPLSACDDTLSTVVDAPPLTRSDVEPPGAHCATGGTAVHAGHDLDGNGVLDDTEIEATAYRCHAPEHLTREDALPANLECPSGSTALHSGRDLDGNGELGDAEIEDTTVACNSTEIFEGDFFAADWEDPIKVAALERAKIVNGNLHKRGGELHLARLELVKGRVELIFVTKIELPALRQVIGDFDPGAAASLLRADALETIGGALKLTGTSLRELSLPGLTRIGDKLQMSAGVPARIDLPRLEEAGALSFAALNQLETLHLPALTRVERSFTVFVTPELTAMDVGRLTFVGGELRVQFAEKLEQLAMPELRFVGEDDGPAEQGLFLSSTGLHVVELPVLRDAWGKLAIAHNPRLISVSLPALRITGVLEATNNERLTAVAAPTLPSCASIVLTRLPALAALDFAALDEVVSLELESLPLTRLPGLAALRRVEVLAIDGLDGLVDLSGLTSLARLETLRVRRSGITSLRGLERVTTMSGDLALLDNDHLSSLVGLDQLTELTGSLDVQDNPRLPEALVDALRVRLGKLAR